MLESVSSLFVDPWLVLTSWDGFSRDLEEGFEADKLKLRVEENVDCEVSGQSSGPLQDDRVKVLLEVDKVVFVLIRLEIVE